MVKTKLKKRGATIRFGGQVHLSQLRELDHSGMLQRAVQRLAATDGSVAAAHDTAAAAAILSVPEEAILATEWYVRWPLSKPPLDMICLRRQREWAAAAKPTLSHTQEHKAQAQPN